MIGLFKRQPRAAPADTSRLGESVIAMVVPAGSAQAPGCMAVLVEAQGRARRVEASARLAPEPGETAWLFRPGPYRLELRPFAAAPELGLRMSFVIDAPDPRAHQQRFDLYLASEVQGSAVVLEAAALYAAIEAAVQRELAQGHLALPPCTTLAEWNGFRAGLNRLLYLRFGVTVDECLPVDLGAGIDYAAQLRERAASAPVAMPAVPESSAAAQVGPMEPVAPVEPPADAGTDSVALRRLFLELPCLMCALRAAVLPRGPQLFRRHQELLRRLDLASLQVSTMPAFELAAPGVRLGAADCGRRAAHTRRAAGSLDEAWALLARLQGEDEQDAATAPEAMAALFEDLERVAANLEYDLAGRRAVAAPDQEAA